MSDYYTHALTSPEYLEGKNAAVLEVFHNMKVYNPYSYGSEESIKWLNWKLGYDSISKERGPMAFIPSFTVVTPPDISPIDSRDFSALDFWATFKRKRFREAKETQEAADCYRETTS